MKRSESNKVYTERTICAKILREKELDVGEKQKVSQ
jgi:hypothetical protein